MKRAPRGLTLLELVVVAAIASLLAVLAVPSVLSMRRGAYEDATIALLRRLGEAVHRYAADVVETNAGFRALPPDLDHLVANGSGVPSWRGPYLASPGSYFGPTTTATLGRDAWDEGLRFERLGASSAAPADVSRVRITSAGADGAFGSRDDLVLLVDAAPEFRAEALRRLEAIHRAIETYHADHLFGPYLGAGSQEAPAGTGALPAEWAAARSILVSLGYLPDDPGTATDPWGNAFVADGFAPLSRVLSTRF